MRKVIFLLGQRSNVDFYFSERRNKTGRQSATSAVIDSHAAVSLDSLALFILTRFSILLYFISVFFFWCLLQNTVLVVSSVRWGGWWQHLRQPGTVAYYSKAKCQYFKAITFEPRGPPSLGCYRNSLAKRKWVGVQSRHFISFSI